MDCANYLELILEILMDFFHDNSNTDSQIECIARVRSFQSSKLDTDSKICLHAVAVL